MSLKIRLARGGSKHRPYYNVVIADSRFARDGRFIEKIGSYNPLLAKTDEKRVQIDLEKAKEWLEERRPADRSRRAFPRHRRPREVGARQQPETRHPGRESHGTRQGAC